ncbi:MAG TPA: amidohydrolase family protein [Acidimicrobiales bacterium]|nr:amidohydrolase family protein [Acidimicrobiales bacterium]
MLNGHTVIDADSHVHDYQVDWRDLVPADLRDLVPRTYYEPSGFAHIEVEGRLLPGGEHDTAERNRDWARDPRYWVPPRQGEFDPVARLPDMDDMGIDVCVLFGGHCFLVASKVTSPDVASATLRAYNEFIASYCAASPERLKGVAMIAMQSPAAAAAELERAVRELGLVGAVLPPHHANGTTLDDPALDPIWSAAQDLDVPVCIHTIGAQISPVQSYLRGDVMPHAYGSVPSMLALGHLVLGGVLDRFPRLTVCFLEAGAGWVPYVMDRLEANYQTFGLRSKALAKSPAEYIRSEQLYFAADADETTLPAVIDAIGADRIVVGSDYCHPEGMCPLTMRVLAEREDVSPGAKKQILCDNPRRLYRL